MYDLPDTLELSTTEVFQRLSSPGLDMVIDDGGIYRRASTEELGL